MKWIGQHIYDQISRFRNEVYLESVSASTETDMLVVDSAGKVTKRAIDAITVDVSDFLGDGEAYKVVTATGTDGMRAEPFFEFRNTANKSELGLMSNEDTGDFFRISTTTHGATTLQTVDDDANAAHFEISADGNITLECARDIALEAGTGGVTVDTDNFTIESSTGNKPNVAIKSTTNSNKGSTLNFISDKGAVGVDGDYIGTILFTGDNDAQAQTVFGQLSCEVNSADADDPEGKVFIHVRRPTTNGGSATGSGLTLTGQPNSEVDALIGAGAASTTTVAGTLTMGSTAAMGNTGLLTVGAQTGITAAANLVTVGAIGTGTWESTDIAVAHGGTGASNLDAFCMLAGNQTLTGVKTFNEAINKKALHFVYTANKFTLDTSNEILFSLVDAERDIAKGSEDGVGVVAIVPCTGVLKHVIINTSSNLSTKTWEFRLYRVPDGTANTGEILVATVASNAGPASHTNKKISFVSGTADTNVITYVSGYSATTMFTAGDRALLSLQSNSDAAGSPKINATLCFELDESTI